MRRVSVLSCVRIEGGGLPGLPLVGTRSMPFMDEAESGPLSREEMQQRWRSASPRERREMMRRVRASERSTPEGAARDRRRKTIVYSTVGLIIACAFVYQLVGR